MTLRKYVFIYKSCLFTVARLCSVSLTYPDMPIKGPHLCLEAALDLSTYFPGRHNLSTHLLSIHYQYIPLMVMLKMSQNEYIKKGCRKSNLFQSSKILKVLLCMPTLLCLLTICFLMYSFKWSIWTDGDSNYLPVDIRG